MYSDQKEVELSRPKRQFLDKLKAFLMREKGSQIYDTVLMAWHSLATSSSGSFLTCPAFVTLDLDLDLMKMIHFDVFLGENFIKCLLRYYPYLSQFAKDVFILEYEMQESALQNNKSPDLHALKQKLEAEAKLIEANLSLKINLRLTHFPYSVGQVSAHNLMKNHLLKEFGQLVQVKLARVVNVFQPSVYIYENVYKSQCDCGEVRTKVVRNDNPIKIFKNQLGSSTKLNKANQYNQVFDDCEIICEFCSFKYKLDSQKFAPCQKAEVFALEQSSPLISLPQAICSLWLADPFVGALEVGDVINFTGFYFMVPKQTMDNGRCISPLQGSFVAFDIVKVNPFHQMVGKDVHLAKLFYNNSGTSNHTSKSSINKSLLTLENIKIHESQFLRANNKFYPKLNQLTNKLNKRQTNPTNFSSTFSLFDGLYDLDSMGQLRIPLDSQYDNYLPMTQDEYKECLLERILDVDSVERAFSQLHLLLDKVFELPQSMQQNSFLFQLKLGLFLSSVVQMKNSLVKYMDFEAKEIDPTLATQQVKIQQFGEVELNFDGEEEKNDTDIDECSVFTPQTDFHHGLEMSDFSGQSLSRENLHLLVVTDDICYFNYSVQVLKSRGIKVVEAPTIYDPTSIVPFFLMHDHSIVVLRNPSKRLLPFISSVVRKGTIYFEKKMPIKVNVTLWVVVEGIPLIEKQKPRGNQPQKKLTELVVKEYGADFLNLFDLIVDLTCYSNLDLLGTNFMKYQEDYIVNSLSQNLQGFDPEKRSEFLFDIKDFKCTCPSEVYNSKDKVDPFLEEKLSVGEIFIQYYYISQRRLHFSQQVDESSDLYGRFVDAPPNLSFHISLGDVLKIKKLADNLSFMRLFFLKNTWDHIEQARYDDGRPSQQLEIIDCVLAIFLFELRRIFKNGKIIHSREGIQYKILHFFSKLKLAREADERSHQRNSSLLTQPDDEMEDDLEEIIQGVQKSVKEQQCNSCKREANVDVKFKNVYKSFIQNMIESST